MITAQEARALIAKNKKAMEAELLKIEGKVKKACEAGETLIQHDLPSAEWITPTMTALEAHGFKTNQIHSSGIDVRW